jgi:hypothetical protein
MQGMISDLMADSRRWEEELSRERRRAPGRTAHSYRPGMADEREDYGSIPGRGAVTRVRERDEYPIRRQTIAEHPQTQLFDRRERERLDPRQDPRPDPRPDPRLDPRNPEILYDQRDRIIVHGSSGYGGSSLSRSSTYDAPSIGSRETQWSSRSSFSTAPSSVQGMPDERRRLEQAATPQYATNHSITPQEARFFQGAPAATESYTDPRTGERVTLVTRPGDQRLAGSLSALQRRGSSPDWDETPNFRELAPDR